MTAMTNYEKIRAMSVEEMAAIIMCPNDAGIGNIPCDKSDSSDCFACLLKWLNSEAEA